jgi:NADPH:quinone reductase-like Zn-dependent oxidoreductase
MSSNTMAGVVLKGHGGLEQLEYRKDLPIPDPGPGEVLIKLTAAAVNNTDINLRVGWYSKTVGTATADALQPAATVDGDAGWGGEHLRFPRIQGADGCGHIVAVGRGVDPARLGQRVLIDPIIRHADGTTTYFGSDCNGSFAEYTAVPNANACAITSLFTDTELASFPCSYLAAEHMLTRAGVTAGDTVLITGASGGVGSAAVQLARARAATVLAVSHPSKSAALAALGVTAVLDRGASLIAALGEQSVDVVIDVVGGSAFAEYLAVLKPRGRYAVAGAIAGPIVSLDLRTLYLKDLTFHGCTIPEPAVFRQVLAAIESGSLRPVVSETYPLAALAEAQEAFLKKSHVGKVALRI